MDTLLDRMSGDVFESAISPNLELGAYEHLWFTSNLSFKKISDQFSKSPGARPSEFVGRTDAINSANQVHARFRELGIRDYHVMLKGVVDYPERLLDAKYPLELFYFRGDWSLVSTKGIAIVGTRNPSDEGRSRARRLSKELGEEGYTIVSGLAEGIDTEAHVSCIKSGAKTIAVLGTPLTHHYPAKNAGLQNEIARNHLVISQVPVRKYEASPVSINRFFFPERNVTMSALSEATVIVEAGKTSGTLVQARAALSQGRKLFILESCFQNKNIDWPGKFEAKGAIKVGSTDEILENLAKTSTN